MVSYNKLTLQLDLWNSKLRSYLLGDLQYESYLLENSREEQVFTQYMQKLKEEGFYDDTIDYYYRNIKKNAEELITLKKQGKSLLEIAKKYKMYEENYCLPLRNILLHIPKHFLLINPKL